MHAPVKHRAPAAASRKPFWLHPVPMPCRHSGMRVRVLSAATPPAAWTNLADEISQTTHAPIAQRTERGPPKAEAVIRLHLGAPTHKMHLSRRLRRAERLRFGAGNPHGRMDRHQAPTPIIIHRTRLSSPGRRGDRAAARDPQPLKGGASCTCSSSTSPALPKAS